MKLTAPDMLKEKLIDGIIEEPLGGAHYEPEVAFRNVKSTILSNIKSLKKFNGKELMEQRQEKFINMGKFKG